MWYEKRPNGASAVCLCVCCVTEHTGRVCLRPSPQGTVYQKTNAEVEMKKINREEFWEQAKVSAGGELNHRKRSGVATVTVFGGV